MNDIEISCGKKTPPNKLYTHTTYRIVFFKELISLPTNFQRILVQKFTSILEVEFSPAEKVGLDEQRYHTFASKKIFSTYEDAEQYARNLALENKIYYFPTDKNGKIDASLD